MISAVNQKIANAALDRLETFAALTRAHAGLAELRPPRSQQANNRTKSVRRRERRRCGALPRRGQPFRHCERPAYARYASYGAV
jgi:hypothetical protein